MRRKRTAARSDARRANVHPMARRASHVEPLPSSRRLPLPLFPGVAVALSLPAFLPPPPPVPHLPARARHRTNALAPRRVRACPTPAFLRMTARQIAHDVLAQLRVAVRLRVRRRRLPAHARRRPGAVRAVSASDGLLRRFALHRWLTQCRDDGRELAVAVVPDRARVALSLFPTARRYVRAWLRRWRGGRRCTSRRLARRAGVGGHADRRATRRHALVFVRKQRRSPPRPAPWSPGVRRVARRGCAPRCRRRLLRAGAHFSRAPPMRGRASVGSASGAHAGPVTQIL